MTERIAAPDPQEQARRLLLAQPLAEPDAASRRSTNARDHLSERLSSLEVAVARLESERPASSCTSGGRAPKDSPLVREAHDAPGLATGGREASP